MASATDLLVETKGLTKRYRRVLAVDSLNLTVRRGEVYGFLGPNGAGKTTTLRMLVGLVRPTAGSAMVAHHAPGKSAGLRRVGALIERAPFYPYLSGRSNLRVMAGYAHVAPARVERALRDVGLAAQAGRRFGSYSLGMKQRLGIAAALLKQPELLILDEPTNGLDPQGVIEVRSLIRRLAQEGATVLFSSHQLAEVEQLCDRAGVISGGRLVVERSVKELRAGTAVVVRAAPPDRAWTALAAFAGRDAVRRVDGVFHVAIDPERADELNAALVNAGVGVVELRHEQKSLEEVFLQLVEEEAS